MDSKRNMLNPDAFVGKRIDMYTAWNIPDGYAVCAMTGKFDRCENLSVTFPHYLFDKTFLKTHGIYVEDADWLSAEGYDEIIDVLDRLGMLSTYLDALEHEREIIRGDYPEVGSGFAITVAA